MRLSTQITKSRLFAQIGQPELLLFLNMFLWGGSFFAIQHITSTPNKLNMEGLLYAAAWFTFSSVCLIAQAIHQCRLDRERKLRWLLDGSMICLGTWGASLGVGIFAMVNHLPALANLAYSYEHMVFLLGFGLLVTGALARLAEWWKIL